MKNFRTFRKIVKTSLELITLYLVKHATVAAFIYIRHHYHLDEIVDVSVSTKDSLAQLAMLGILIFPMYKRKKLLKLYNQYCWYIPRIFIATSALCNISHCEWDGLLVDLAWFTADIIVHVIKHRNHYHRKGFVMYGRSLQSVRRCTVLLR